jgi:hypothetical protein
MSILFVLVSLARAAEPVAAWTTREVPLHRWNDGAVVVATLDPGARVEVLLADGAHTRVRRGIDFGWVPSDALTKEAPADAAPTFTLGPGMTLTPSGTTPPAK